MFHFFPPFALYSLLLWTLIGFVRNLTVRRHYFDADEINVDISDNNAVNNDDHLKFSFKEQCVITDMEDLRFEC